MGVVVIPNGYPPRSNDFNPVENVISHFKQRVFSKNPKSMCEFYDCLFRVWNEFEIDFWAPIIESMDKRLQQCIERGGDKTDY